MRRPLLLQCATNGSFAHCWPPQARKMPANQAWFTPGTISVPSVSRVLGGNAVQGVDRVRLAHTTSSRSVGSMASDINTSV